jgi:hypothetical protein
MVVVRAAPAPPVDPVNELRSLGHGLAILMLDGPLGRLSRAERTAMVARVVDDVIARLRRGTAGDRDRSWPVAVSSIGRVLRRPVQNC